MRQHTFIEKFNRYAGISFGLSEEICTAYNDVQWIVVITLNLLFLLTRVSVLFTIFIFFLIYIAVVCFAIVSTQIPHVKHLTRRKMYVNIYISSFKACISFNDFCVGITPWNTLLGSLKKLLASSDILWYIFRCLYRAAKPSYIVLPHSPQRW